MKIKVREFYIYTKDGEDVWHRDLADTDSVIQDYINHKDDPTFRIEIQDWYYDDFEWVEVFPQDEGIDSFPKYVQQAIKKVLKDIDLYTN